MGGRFEAVIDAEANLDAARRLAASVSECLTAEGLVDAVPADEGEVSGTGNDRSRLDHPHTVGDREVSIVVTRGTR
jgi:hypothetical protein